MISNEELFKYNVLWWCVIVVCLLVLTCSCRSIQYVPVETVKTETEYRDRVQRDSIHIRDSVFMFVNGDTIFRDRWHTEYKNRFVRDTVIITDSIKVEVPYPVEKKLSFWQRVKMGMGTIMIFMIPVAFIIIGWLAYKKRIK